MTATPDPIQARPAAEDAAATPVLDYTAEKPARRRTRLPPWTGALVVMLLLGGITWFVEPSFRRPQNLLNIAQTQAAVGILAVGMTLVIISGGIDLSVGSLLALAGGVGILTLDKVAGATPGPARDVTAVVLAALVTLAVGTAAGLVNGLLVAKGRLPAFIATLAALLAFRSAAAWIVNGGEFHPVRYAGAAFDAIGGGIPIHGTNISRNRRLVIPLTVSYQIIVWLVAAVGAAVLLNRTRLGRYAVAVGNNPRAARYSAVPVDRVRILIYTISGLLAGVAGFMKAAEIKAVNSGNAGISFELYAIAAAVIGGTRMEGGVGSIFGAVVGALLLGVINNVLTLMNVNSQAQGVVMGVIIVVAALAQRQKAAT